MLNFRNPWVWVGAGVGAYVLVQTIRGGAEAVVAAVNPADRRNLAYSAVNAVGSAISGDNHWSLGGWFYELTHKEYDPNKVIDGVEYTEIQ